MRRHLWLGAVLIIALVAYWPSFTAAFQFDDYSHIVGNGDAFASLPSFLAFANSRIVSVGSLALNYRFSGEQPLPYHVVNFIVHLAAISAVYFFALALCRTPRLRHTWLAQESLPFAASAAFLFACHPIQIQAVTYIVQRIASLAAFFYVASLWSYVRARNAQLGIEAGRPRLLYTAAAMLALGAFLSKENTVTLPAAILLVEWTFYGTRVTAAGAARLSPFLLFALAIPLFWALFGHAPPALRKPGAGLGERGQHLMRLLAYRAAPGGLSALDYFFTQCLVIPQYLRLVLLPWGFNVDHDVPLATALSPAVAAGLAFLASLLAFGLYALRRWPVLGFGIVWLFVTLAVESSVFPITDVMVEHRMYLPMAGVALLIANAFAWALSRRRNAALVLGVAVIVLLSILTFRRNQVWQTPLALWSDALAKSPGKARVYGNVGTALHSEGRFDDAIDYYCKALALDPGSRQARTNLNIALGQQQDEQLDAGREIVLNPVNVGPDGSLELEAPDPCARRKPGE